MQYLVKFILFLASFNGLLAQTEVCDGDLCVVQFNAALNCTTHISSPHRGDFSSDKGLLALVETSKNNKTEIRYFILL